MEKDVLVKKLSQFKEYGESVLQILDSLSQIESWPDWVPTELPHQLDLIRATANQTIERASSAVKIGVMGEFSSGKTLLLGSLIGFADALPISEIPTTGNVTAIRFIQQPGLQTTKVSSFSFKYLSHQGVKDCLSFMLQEALKRASRLELSSEQLQTLASLKPTDPEIWHKLIQWSRQAWANPNPELRFLLRELVIFARTYSSCGVVCGSSYEIDSDTAKEGLQLSDLQMDFQNLRFDDLPPAPKMWQKQPEYLGVEDLQSSFSLIRRVEVTVEVSKEIWDLSSLQGVNEFVLLDFPGLGAANSGVRDTFLSLRELAEVQTILILLNGRVPGGDRANQIFTMMQEQRPQADLKDRILVSISRFDQLPLGDGGNRILDELIGNSIFEAESLQEATVLEKLKVLKNLIAGAQTFTTQPSRIVLLSPRLKLAQLAKTWSTVQVGSQKFIADLEYTNFLQQFEPLRQQWQQLSEELLASNPRSNLGRQLHDFTEDGGINRLQELIENHVATHGLNQLYLDTRTAAQSLQAQQNNLHNLLEEIQHNGLPTTENPAFSVLRQSIQTLIAEYRNFKENLGKNPLQNRRGEAISEVVKEELTFRIYNWSEWSLLFNKVKDGAIAIEAAQADVIAEIFGTENSVSNLIPTKSDDFYPLFVKTFQELEIFTRECTQQAVTDLLSQLSAKVAQVRHNLKEILRPETGRMIQQNFGNEVDSFNRLLKADDPNTYWKEAIIKRSGIADSSVSPINPGLFPLARQDKQHQIGQIFDWAPEWSQRNVQQANHQILVLRLRDEMIAGAGLHLVQLVSEVTKQVNATLTQVLDFTISFLEDISRKEALLRYIAAPEEQSGIAPQWLQTIAEIAAVNYPE